MPHTLSKSDYLVARTCATKLYYRKLGYPTTKDDNQYLKLLADGGYMVEEIARLLHPGGQFAVSDGNAEDDSRRTVEALRQEHVTLFGATVLSGHKLARIDILRKAGNEIELIEVKSGSYSSDEAREREAKGKPSVFRTAKGAVAGEWRLYIEDLAFQVLILQELLPSAVIRPYLMLPDTSKTTSVDLLHQHFLVRRIESVAGRSPTVAVEFTGDAEMVRGSHFLAKVGVEREVRDLLPEVRDHACSYVASLQPTLRKIATPIALHCQKCEFHAGEDGGPDGFLECWGDLGRVAPHIFDLVSVGTVGPQKDRLANQLIREGKTRLSDIPAERLVKKDGKPSATNERQLIQMRHTKTGTAWISEELAGILRGFQYPLHFLDFETSGLAVPYHANMRPYQTVAFQWSCHTLSAPAAQPVHREWINTENFYPNIEFARILRDCIGVGAEGTVFMWATHERTVLRRIAGEIRERKHEDQSLAAWIDDLAGRDGEGKLVDLNAIAARHFFHPAMRGKTSIKYVLDAVWSSDSVLRSDFPKYVREDDGRLVSPYRALPPLLVAGVDVSVQEGTGAMRAYQHMLYGAGREEPDVRTTYRDLLRQYCELDTAAMLMIWRHWCRSARSTSPSGPQ